MASQNRGSSPDLKSTQTAFIRQDLISNGWRYNFFQAMRLLRCLAPSQKGIDAPASKTVHVRPDLSLAFPAADIAQIQTVESDCGEQCHITVNFLGLYGSSSPLPTFYTEELIEEAGQDESVSRDFLDIIHKRLYDLLFHAWMKNRLFFQISEMQSAEQLERLYCLLGIGTPELRKSIPDAMGLLRYIGLFTQLPHSMAGLKTLLQDALKDVPLQIVPCVHRMAKIPDSQRLQMGMTGCRLGMDSYLGEEIADRSGKFKIQIGPLSQAGFLRFTPGNSDYVKLTGLTELYITEPFEYDVELILADRQAETVCLGDPVRAVLGVTTWVFSTASIGEVRTRFTVTRS